MERWHRRTDRGAFSLVELLVVISIVGVLVSMLLPSLSQSRQVARSSICSSNTHQQYLGLSAYATDHRDYIPANNTGGGWAAGLGSVGYFGAHILTGPKVTDWAWANYPKWRIFQCPAEPGVDFSASGYASSATNWDNEFIRSSYAMNWSVHQYDYSRPRRGFSNPRGISPDRGTFVADHRAAVFGWDFIHFEWSIDGALTSNTAYAFHHPNQTYTMLFMDGHTDPGRKHISRTGEPNFVWLWPNGDKTGI